MLCIDRTNQMHSPIATDDADLVKLIKLIRLVTGTPRVIQPPNVSVAAS
jgi:hypothetical protein